MDLNVFLLGLLSFAVGFIFIIYNAANDKKVDLYRIRIYGWLICCLILGIYLMYIAFKNN